MPLAAPCSRWTSATRRSSWTFRPAAELPQLDLPRQLRATCATAHGPSSVRSSPPRATRGCRWTRTTDQFEVSAAYATRALQANWPTRSRASATGLEALTFDKPFTPVVAGRQPRPAGAGARQPDAPDRRARGWRSRPRCAPAPTWPRPPDADAAFLAATLNAALAPSVPALPAPRWTARWTPSIPTCAHGHADGRPARQRQLRRNARDNKTARRPTRRWPPTSSWARPRAERALQLHPGPLQARRRLPRPGRRQAQCRCRSGTGAAAPTTRWSRRARPRSGAKRGVQAGEKLGLGFKLAKASRDALHLRHRVDLVRRRREPAAAQVQPGRSASATPPVCAPMSRPPTPSAWVWRWTTPTTAMRESLVGLKNARSVNMAPT
jgi:hypothetical protein